MEGLIYWHNSDLNTINQRYRLASEYKLTERWSVTAGGRYLKDTTLDSQLEETGYVAQRQNRRRLNAGGGASYALSERSEIGADYGFQKTDYQSSSSVDTIYNTASVYYKRRLKNEKDVLSLFPEFTYGTSDDYDAYSTTLNFRWQHPYSETLDMSITAGLRNTYVDYKNDQGNTTNWGGVADMWLRKKGEVTVGRVGFSNQLRPISDGSIRNVARLYTDMDHRLSRRFGVGFRGGIYYSQLIKNKSQNADKRWYFDLSPSAFYRLTEQHILRLLYSYDKETLLDVSGDDTRDRHRVWLQLTFNFPNSW